MSRPTPVTKIQKIIDQMDACPNADKLYEQVIGPFTAALEEVCRARGYLLNIYGGRVNLAITNEDDAPVIHDLIESYLDQSEGE